MTGVTYDKADLTIEVDGLEGVARALEDIPQKTPAVAKVAINNTTRQARKLMIAAAKARYAVNRKGQERLADLKQRKRATATSLAAELHIKSLRNDLGYFDTRPAVPTHFKGGAWRHGPDVFRGRVLKSSSLYPLNNPVDEHGRRVSKGFLVEFKSGHVGMVQRLIGVKAKNDTPLTERGYPRWKNKRGPGGIVEQLVTMGSPSATAMHNKIWPQVQPEAEAYLMDQLYRRAERVLILAAEKRARA